MESVRLAGDEAALFARYHEQLVRSVAASVQTSRANVEDACSFAWTQLMCTQPERREGIFGWLRLVALREAVRLDGSQLRCAPTADFGELAHDGRRLEDARAALEHVAQLSPRVRRVFALHVAGYSYEEIAERTGATSTTVARLMSRARAVVRRGA